MFLKALVSMAPTQLDARHQFDARNAATTATVAHQLDAWRPVTAKHIKLVAVVAVVAAVVAVLHQARPALPCAFRVLWQPFLRFRFLYLFGYEPCAFPSCKSLPFGYEQGLVAKARFKAVCSSSVHAPLPHSRVSDPSLSSLPSSLSLSLSLSRARS